ncbi:MAG: hypothetical protein RIB60_10960 [Phycisphaerales bacterium]
MLKFIRKYQLLILVVGGSLLMVVFLLQPVLTRMAPNPGNRTAAEIGLTGTKVSGNELSQASTEVRMIGAFLPGLLQANTLGIGLDATERNWDDHWLLLTREAEKGGFIAGPQDGLDWIPELASMIALEQADMEMQQRRFRSEAEYIARRAELEQALTAQFARAANQIPPSFRMTQEEFGMALAKARGIRRMLNAYGRAPKPSRQQAIAQTRDARDAVQFDFVRVPATIMIDEETEPTEAELGEFFERYRESEPEDNEFGLSYVLEPRIKYAVLELSRTAIMTALIPDRIELNKRWRANRDLYPGEFSEEMPNVDADWRAERAEELLIDADQILRAEVRRALRAYPEEDGVYEIPAGELAVNYEQVAQAIAEELQQRSNVIIPLPTVRIVTDEWQTSMDLRLTRGLGQAMYRVANRQYSAAFLPELLDPEREEELLPAQVGVPIVEVAAEDPSGTRYYVTVLDHRSRSAAESIDEVGRDEVINDWRTLNAYQRLLERKPQILSAARETGGLTAVVDLLEPQEEGSEAPAGRTLRVNRAARAVRDQLANTFDANLNTPEVREAIMSAAAQIDPMTDPQMLDRETSIMVLELPSAMSLVAIEIVAPRPLTQNDYRLYAPFVIPSETDAWLREDADFVDSFPFTFEALKAKYQYRVLETDDEDAPAEASAES